MTVLSTRYTAALDFARRAHEGQFRKGTQIPYFAHVAAVSCLVLDNGGDEDQAIAGLLHDVVEDGGPGFMEKIREQFGERVLGIVLDCTDGGPGADRGAASWRERKEAYIASMASKSLPSLLVSACDKLHNARAVAADHSILGEAIFDRFNAGKAGVVWYYRALSAAVSARLPGLSVTHELALAVSRFADA